MTPKTELHLQITMNDEELSTYTNRPEVMNFTPEQNQIFLARLEEALFDNNFWDICRVVLMEMEDDVL